VKQEPIPREKLAEMVMTYLEDNSPESFLAAGDASNVPECFSLMKQAYAVVREKAKAPTSEDAMKQIKELRARVA
jgi:hypothetical protein